MRRTGHEHFVDGVTEGLTTDLSTDRHAVVIGRNAAFTYKASTRSEQIGRELNVRLVLEEASSGVEIACGSMSTIDAETGNYLWAEPFDKPLADLFDMQDETESRLANTLDARLVSAEARRAEHAPGSPTRWTSIFRVWLGSIRV